MPGNAPSVKHSPILWIEGRWAGNKDFVQLLQKKGFQIETVSTGKQAIDRIASKSYDLLIVNAASMRTSGGRICKGVHESFPELPMILISAPGGKPKDVEKIVHYILELEFTTRKLVNRIMKLLPGEPDRMIRRGPIVVDPDRSLTICNGVQTTLTPRLMALLMTFLEHAGEVVAREELFKEVWKTSYTGDTRTLDVHISWLRQAIEVDPRNPKLLQTVRGVGYKLDI